MEIQKAIDKIYTNNTKGNKLVIPEEYIDEYNTFAKDRVKEFGNSVRASNKRVFLFSNTKIIYKKEYKFLKEHITNLYDSGYGLKLIAKEVGLTYSRVRTLFNILDININNGRNICYDRTRQIRSDNLKDAYKNRTQWFSTLARKTNKTSRGVQGYYFNKSRNKYVWLRSSYEYVYAKWLDKQNMDWDIEQQTFQLNKTTYRPDFFIYENNKLTKIVEIKGYWARGLVKTEELKNKLDIEVLIIRDIKPYSETNRELEIWKTERLSEQELKEL